MPVLELSFDCGESSLSVRRFAIQEGISTLFDVSVWARSPDAAIDLASIVGRPATFRIQTGYANVLHASGRVFSGICSYMELSHVDTTGLSTYSVRIVPRLWVLGRRRNNRIFQHLSIPDIIDELLGAWSIAPTWEIDRGRYPKLEYKVQYGESDLAFFHRLLEEAGIAYLLSDANGDSSALVLSDRLASGAPRAGGAIGYVDNPNRQAEREFVSRVHIAHEVRPGGYTIRDYDFRNPAFPLFGDAKAAIEQRYEQYHYLPGGTLVETGRPGDTPVADDKGLARYDQSYGKGRAERSLLGERMGRESVAFGTNVVDLRPGTIFAIDRHPHPELPEDRKLLVSEFSAEGTPDGEWVMSGRAVFAEIPYRPPIVTPRPVVDGFQSAVVVGPKGQEIHTDEFGRVRVQFHWDREGKSDENSSCWIRVSQGWGGAGWGMHILPRIGQEVLVNFLEGDPDQPVVLGRAYNSIEPVPYRLPENKTISTWKSDSTLGSNGFNEIKFEDKAGEEYFYVQAERNLRKLVKNDETITVLRDRRKGVVGHETDTTGVNRTEVTGVNRIDITGQWRILFVGGKRAQWIKGKETERTQGYLKRLVKGGADGVVKGKKRERVEDDVHLHVTGDRRERIDGKQSLTVLEDQHEKVGQNHALETGKAIHFVAGEDAVGEGGVEVAVKGPGGFIAIDASGVTINGNVVKINAGGSPGKGKGSKPEPPEEAEVALVGVPKLPRGNDKGMPAGEDWVEVSLLDDADPPAPVPFARYRVESDDGVVHEGLLDAQGKAIVTGVKPGKCKVSFPDLDGASWGEKK